MLSLTSSVEAVESTLSRLDGSRNGDSLLTAAKTPPPPPATHKPSHKYGWNYQLRVIPLPPLASPSNFSFGIQACLILFKNAARILKRHDLRDEKRKN